MRDRDRFVAFYFSWPFLLLSTSLLFFLFLFFFSSHSWFLSETNSSSVCAHPQVSRWLLAKIFAERCLRVYGTLCRRVNELILNFSSLSRRVCTTKLRTSKLFFLATGFRASVFCLEKYWHTEENLSKNIYKFVNRLYSGI